MRRRAHAWCSIALPDDVPAPASSTKLTGEPGAVAGLRRAVRGLTASLLDRPAGSVAHTAAAHALHAAAVDCLAGGTQPRAAVGRLRLDRRTIMRRAMAAIDAAVNLPTAAELARDAGVTGRTLQRAFHEAFGLSPKRYLLLRELHAVRRSLRDGGRRGDTVGDVLVRRGIWEFGRFAARYRRHFDELPSATMRRR